MQKIVFTFMAFLFSGMLIAQVTLEKTYNYSSAVVKFETLGYKYYVMDVPNSQCRIYNLDHSIFKTINCSVPSNCYLADIKYLSENLFDNDSGIELIYTWYKYIPTQDAYYYEYDSKIINEDGSAITTIEGARYVYVNAIGENVSKLFAYCFDYSVFPEIVWTNIYSLPGMPVFSAKLEDKPDFELNGFPNPAENSVKMAYSLPKNVEEGTLFLFDNNGRFIERFVVDRHTDHLLLDVSKYQSGVYNYFVESGNKKSVSKKLVIK